MSNTPQTIPLDAFLEQVEIFAHQDKSIPTQSVKSFKDMLTYMSGDSGVLDSKEALDALQRFSSALEHNEPSFFLQPRGRKVDKLVDVIEFIESSEYLGLAGAVWPSVKENLYNIYHGPRSSKITEVVLGGGVGVAKSYTAELGLAYMLYDLSTYHCPQLEFGLSPGSGIFFICQSVDLGKAKKVLFENLAQKLRTSPYFLREFSYNKEVRSELQFPNYINVIPVASGDTSAMGLNCYGAILDELNYMMRVEGSKKSRFTDNGEEYDQAHRLYTLMARRIKSRFSKKGSTPGKLYLMSSAAYDQDFISRKVEEYNRHEAEGKESHIYVSMKAQWEARPRDLFLPESFFVEVGDATRRSRMLSSKDEAIDADSVIEVPMDFHPDFQADIEAAIRDLAGIPVGASSAFIKDREGIERAAQEHKNAFGGMQLFNRDSVDLTVYSSRLDTLLNSEFLNLSTNDLTASYVIHLDLSVTGDSCGFAMGHCGGMKAVGKAFDYDEATGKYREAAPGEKPITVTDGVLEILPPLGGEIDLNLVGDLVELIASRLNVEVVSADSFQSTALLQRFRKFINCKGKRLHAQLLSVDRTLAPYAALKQSLRDGRLVFPNHEKLKKELREVYLDHRKSKVEHWPSGSKDLSDPVAAVTYTIDTLEGRKSNRGEAKREDGVRRIRTGRRNLH